MGNNNIELLNIFLQYLIILRVYSGKTVIKKFKMHRMSLLLSVSQFLRMMMMMMMINFISVLSLLLAIQGLLIETLNKKILSALLIIIKNVC